MDSNQVVLTGNFGVPQVNSSGIAHEQYRAALETFAIVSEMDHKGTLTHVNKRFCDVSGYTQAELLGQHHKILDSGKHSEALIADLRNTLASNAVWHGELCNRARDGSLYWVATTIIPVLRPGHSRVEKFISFQFDVTDKKNLVRKMDAMSRRDLLTNLPNRSEFSNQFHQRINGIARFDQVFAVAVLDIDGFKTVNDVHGQHMGDELLIKVAERLSSELRPEDIVARIGGDEFALLLCHADISLQKICARLLTSLQTPFWIGGMQLNISASIGIRICTNSEIIDIDQALRHASIALYRAKSENKNCCRIFDTTQDLEARKNYQLRSECESALANGEFEAHFQPIVHLASSRPVAFESLIRWRHPIRGVLPPSDFLPAIENDKQILMVGEWMLAKALEFSQTLFELKLPHTVSVNIAALHLQHPGFVGLVKSLLERHSDLPKGSLIIEITESAALTNLRASINVIMQCKKLGAKFSLDDFGTGFSSLTYVRRLPIDELKIDREFIKDILFDDEDQSIVRLIAQLSEIFGLNIVAEGVETAEQAKLLLGLNCQYGQGFGIAKPMPFETALAWAKNTVQAPKPLRHKTDHSTDFIETT